MSFIYDIFFNNFVLNLSFLPIYGLYYMLIRFFLKLNLLKFDFDIGILINDSYLVKDHGELKLELYKNYIITGKSDYEFFNYLDAKFYKQTKTTIFFDITKDTYL